MQIYSKSLIFFLLILSIVVIIELFSIIDLSETSQRVNQTINELKETIEKINRQNKDLNRQIKDLHKVQLDKHEKSMTILLKYSLPVLLNFTSSSLNFIYKNQGLQIRKAKNDESIIYNTNPINIQNFDWRHFQINVTETNRGALSVGVFTEEKKQYLNCGYCKGNDMYYIYGKNSRIYHGEGIFTRQFTALKSAQIKKGDIVTVFMSKSQIIWYINSIYAGSINIDSNKNIPTLYPFIILSQRGDSISTLN